MLVPASLVSVKTPSLVEVHHAVATNNATTYTFNSCVFGPEASDRYLIVLAGGANVNGDLTPHSMSSCTIAGVAATRHAFSPTDFACSAIFGLLRPTDLTGTVTITFGAGMGDAGIIVMAMRGYQSLTPAATAVASDSTCTIVVPANAWTLGCYCNASFGGGSPPTYAWTNVTTRNQYTVDATDAVALSSAYDRGLPAGSRVLTVNRHDDGQGICAACWV